MRGLRYIDRDGRVLFLFRKRISLLKLHREQRLAGRSFTCMIIGIGLDMSRVERWRDDARRNKMLNRFFDPRERDYINSRARMAAESAAGVFAAKEAFAKAAGSGFGVISPENIIILHTPKGKPFYQLTGNAEKAMRDLGADDAHLSITHEGGFAAAMCILEAKER